MNWGYKLMIGFILFVLFIGYLAYRSINTKYELVSKDYYKEELRYQEKIDGRNNAAKISAVNFEQNAESIIVTMPQELKGKTLSGELWFYSSRDETRDKKIALKVDTANQQIISKNILYKTKYLLKFTWKEGTTDYYLEKDIDIN